MIPVDVCSWCIKLNMGKDSLDPGYSMHTEYPLTKVTTQYKRLLKIGREVVQNSWSRLVTS